MTREDRKAIIRRLEAMYGEAEDKDNETKEALFYAIEALKERPHGEWIKKGNNCFCSNCKFELESYILGIFYNFCPNCGSDNRPKGGEEK